MEELKSIIESLTDIRDALDLRVSDESILENATRIYNTKFIQKNRSNSNIDYTKNKSPYHQEPATEKQVNLIKQLNKGVVPAGISKQEAIKLIQELR